MLELVRNITLIVCMPLIVVLLLLLLITILKN